jgi:hypothetical protein
MNPLLQTISQSKSLQPPIPADIAHTRRALRTLTEAAPDAANTLVEIATDPSYSPRDRLTASREILDRTGVGSRQETGGSKTIDVPISYLAAALTGIGLLAGFEMPDIGDSTDLSERVSDMDEALQGIAEVIPDAGQEASAPASPTGKPSYLQVASVPEAIQHRKKQQRIKDEISNS